jgi:hypothetical protein
MNQKSLAKPKSKKKEQIISTGNSSPISTFEDESLFDGSYEVGTKECNETTNATIVFNKWIKQFECESGMQDFHVHQMKPGTYEW